MCFAAGRLESLVNFQTMVMSLTSMDIANASLLDEATAAAEGMVMAFTGTNGKKRTFFADNGVSPQTIAVLKTRAKGFGIKLVVGDALKDLSDETLRRISAVSLSNIRMSTVPSRTSPVWQIPSMQLAPCSCALRTS